MIAAGTLRHRISIQKEVFTQNKKTGAMEHTWAEIAKTWASIQPLSARDFVAAATSQSEVVARITLRFREDIEAGMQIKYRNKTYTIKGVLPDPVSGLEYLTLPVSEGVKR